jgi:hypothetical protein
LNIVGDVHPWVSMLLKTLDERERIRGEKMEQKAALGSGQEPEPEQVSLLAREKVSTQ